MVGIVGAALVVDVVVPIVDDSSCSDVLLLASSSSSMDADDARHDDVDSHGRRITPHHHVSRWWCVEISIELRVKIHGSRLICGTW